MLYPTKALHQARQKLYAEIMNTEGALEGGFPNDDFLQRGLAFDPHSAFILNALAIRALVQEDLVGAESIIMRGLDEIPHLPVFYMHLQELLSRKNADKEPDPDTRSFAFELALRKADQYFDSWMLCKPDQFNEMKEVDLTDWQVVEEIAEVLKNKHAEKWGLSKEWDRQLLLQEILDGADGVVEIDFLEQAVALGGAIRPAIEGLLRSYADPVFEEPIPRTVAIAATILGEIGEAGHLTWMLQLEADGDEDIEQAASWAFHQLAKRHPDRAVAAIRDFAAECPTESLPTLAAHLWHLRNVKQAVSIMEILLESVPDVPTEDRTQMFITIAQAMIRADPSAAKELLPKAYREMRRKLDRRVENILEALLKGSEPDICLLSEQFVNQPLAEFCTNLMLDWDDLAEPDEELDGKSDGGEKTPERPRPWYDPARRIPALQEKIAMNLDKVMDKSDFEKAFGIYSEGVDKLPKHFSTEMLGQNKFLDWVIYDYTSKRLPGGVMMAILKDQPENFNPEERQWIEEWPKMPLTLLEILEVEPGKGFLAKDAFTDETRFIQDVGSSHELAQFDFSLVRPLPFEGNWVLAGDGLRVDRKHIPLIVKWAKDKKKKNQTWADFLKANGHTLRLKVLEAYASFMKNMKISNFEGEPVAFCEAHYELLDKTAAISVLDAHPALDRDDHAEEIVFSWLDAPSSAGAGRRGFGSIRIKGRDMVLECNSEGRLKRGRVLLEQVLVGKIAHVRDKMMTLEEGMSTFRPETSPKEKVDIPEDVQREIVEKYLQEHYAAWPDTSLPALEGKTPRQAAESKLLRPVLEELLKDFINRGEHERKLGKPGYDFRKMARLLGFEELA